MRGTSLTLVALVAAASGCVAPGVNIVTLQPTSLLEPRGADRLVLVDGEGRRAGKEEVADLFRQVARGGFYSVDDRGDDGVKLTLVGKEGRIEGSSKPPRSDELYVRIDVLTWEALPAVFKDTTDDGVVVETPGVHGRADLQISVANAKGEVLMRERAYNGASDVVDDCDRTANPVMLVACGNALLNRAIDDAARGALGAFLGDITPTRVTDYVKYDDGDPGQKNILARAQKEPLNATEKALRRYIKKNENNAIALYNLGVVLDAQGRWEEAIASYDKAMRIVTRDGYVQARGNANARLMAWERIYGPREKPKKKKAEEPSTETKPETKETAPPAP